MIKYIKMILQLKQVADVYEQEKGKDKPAWLTRRFFGVVITALSAIYFLNTGVELNIDAENLSSHIDAIVTGGSVIYGTVMSIYGQIDKKTNTN